MKNLFYKLLFMLGIVNIKVDSKQARKLFYDYYFNIKQYTAIPSYVTKVEVTESKTKGMSILIETHRPGLIIGKGGRDINGFKEYVCKELNRTDVHIDLKECKLWHKLYSDM